MLTNPTAKKQGLMLLLGYMIASWGSYGFYFYRPNANNQWRPMLALQCLPATLLIIFMPLLPESPRWLIKNDRDAEAERVLMKLHEPEEAAIELQQIRAQINIERTLPSDWYTMWKKPSYRKRSLLGFGTCAFIQFSGILVINSKQPFLADIFYFVAVC